MARVNLIPNGSFEFNVTTGWDTSAPAPVREPGWAMFGAASLRKTQTVVSNDSSTFGNNTGAAYPVAKAGSVITASAYYKCMPLHTATGGGPQLVLYWDDGSGTFALGNVGSGATAAPVVGATGRLKVTGTAPAGTTQFRLRLVHGVTSGTQVVDMAWDGILAELGSGLGDYFDGSMIGYYWLGAPFASPSSEQAPVVVSPNIIEPPRHAAVVTLSNGTQLGFGPDEPTVDRQILSLQTATEMPGGFGPGSFEIPRSDRYNPVIVPVNAPVVISDTRSGVTLYEGRVTGTPQAGSQSVNVECEGWSKSLEDDKTAREIFYDRDFGEWGDASAQELVNLLNGGWTITSGGERWDPTTGGPAEVLELSGPWGTSYAASMSMYNAQGIPIAGVDYSAYKTASIDTADSNWYGQVFTMDDDVFSGYDAAQLFGAGSGGAGPWTSTLLSTASGRKFAALFLKYLAPGGSASVLYDLLFTFLGVFGAHGLPLQDTLAGPNSGRGLLVSDMMAYIVGKYAPNLNFSTGLGGSIEPTLLSLPHSTFKDPVTARAMIESLVLYGGASALPLDWGCYEGQRFFAKTPGNYGRTWHLRRDQATVEDDQGQDAGSAINGVMVTYNDGTGTQLSVGPPGSNATLEDSSLVNTDPANPANFSGERHWDLYNGPILSPQAALNVGQMILADSLTRPWRGTVTTQGEVMQDGGAYWPCGLIRAGDYIVVDDDPDTRPRRVVNTSYDGTHMRASVGQTPDHMATVLARADIVLMGRL